MSELLKTGRERALVRESDRALEQMEKYKDTEFKGNARAEERRAKKLEKKYLETIARVTKNRAGKTLNL